MLARVLLAAKDDDLARGRRALSGQDTMLSTSRSENDLWRQLGSQAFDVVVISRAALPDLSAGTITQIRELPDRPEVILISAEEGPEARADILSAGCLAIVDPRVEDRVLRRTLQALVNRRLDEALPSADSGSDSSDFPLSNFESASPVMQDVLSTAHRIAQSDSTILVLGETGVGKEWLARSIHAASPRIGGPFVALNCAALSDALLESDLFGHVKGAYTGAHQPRRGAFEIAHGGTLFLDEIAELPSDLQARLLRAIEERRIRPVGSERAFKVDVRVMAATNRDLEEEMRERRFRRDLYYRLNVVSLTLPPLRERREDVPELVQRCFEEYRVGRRFEVRGIRADALACLCEYDWPGNVRELTNAIERATLLCRGSQITPADLPETMRAGHVAPVARAEPEGEVRTPELDGLADRPWAEVRGAMLLRTERAYLCALLERTRGRVGEAATLAGLDPRSLYAMMRRHALCKEVFRGSPAAGPARGV